MAGAEDTRPGSARVVERAPRRAGGQRSSAGLGRADEEVPHRHPLAVRAVELDGVSADLEAVRRPGPPLPVVADRHVVARHLLAVVRPDVLDEASAVPGHVAVRVDLLAGAEGVTRPRDADELAVD